jgi:hypothetical protein
MGGPAWCIMASYGLLGHEATVQIGEDKRLSFIGTSEWEAFAQHLGSAAVGALPATDGREHVVVKIDGVEVIDNILDLANP